MKNRPALGAMPPDPLCLWRLLGATLPDHRISPIALQVPRCALLMAGCTAFLCRL